MEKTTIYFVRHAEAEGNVYRRCHGTYDSLLTPRAYKQLECLRARFAPVEIAAVYASDLFRARTTAGAIAEPKGLPVQLDGRLREVSMGDWEDCTWAELEVLHPEAFYAWQQKPAHVGAPNGETATESGMRMLTAAKELAAKHLGDSIAVVTHGTAIRGALCAARGLPPEGFSEIPWGDNTCVAKVECFQDGSMDVIYENDASHLPESLSTFAIVDLGQTRTHFAINIWFAPVDLAGANELQRFLHFASAYYKSIGEHVPAADVLLQHAARMQAVDARNVCFCISPDFETPIGIILLDPDASDAAHGAVPALYLSPEARGHRYVLQMLGHATSVYRGAGKTHLRLTLPAPCHPLLPHLYEFGMEEVSQGASTLCKCIVPPNP